MAWFNAGQGRPPTMQETMQMLIETMGSTVVNTNNQLQMLAQTLEASSRAQGDRGSQQGYRALKPKKEMSRVSAESARVLMTELMDFENDLGELGINTMSEAAYRQLRVMVQGKAKDVVDLETAQGAGQQMLTMLNAAGQTNMPLPQRDHLGGQLYSHCVARLEDSVRLTQTKRLAIAEEIYAEAKMFEDSPREAEQFLARWRRARFMMYREHLVNPPVQAVLDSLGAQATDGGTMQVVQRSLENCERREMHHFLQVRVSKSVFEWIWGQPERDQPKNIDDCIHLIERYCEVKVRTLEKDKPNTKVIDGVSTMLIDGVPFAMNDQRVAALFSSNDVAGAGCESRGVSPPAAG